MFRVDDFSEWFNLRDAYERRNLELVKIILDHINPNESFDSLGRTILQRACLDKWLALVRVLVLDPRIDINQKGHIHETWTALTYAISSISTHNEIVFLLLKHGATFDIVPDGLVNTRNWFDYKKLHECAIKRCKKVCIHLIWFGELEPEIKDVMNYFAREIWNSRRESHWIDSMDLFK